MKLITYPDTIQPNRGIGIFCNHSRRFGQMLIIGLTKKDYRQSVILQVLYTYSLTGESYMELNTEWERLIYPSDIIYELNEEEIYKYLILNTI